MILGRCKKYLPSWAIVVESKHVCHAKLTLDALFPAASSDGVPIGSLLLHADRCNLGVSAKTFLVSDPLGVQVKNPLSFRLESCRIHQDIDEVPDCATENIKLSDTICAHQPLILSSSITHLFNAWKSVRDILIDLLFVLESRQKHAEAIFHDLRVKSALFHSHLRSKDRFIGDQFFTLVTAGLKSVIGND